MSDVSRVEAIFLGALEKADPADCAAYLDEQCRDDADVRLQVERLLHAHPRAGRFLEGTQTVDLDVSAGRPGSVIGGRYKLLEPIGEGGMGSVWMAQQTEPVRRTVALKLIKAGMDTRAVLARFEAERQALALMDHPNIARVLDAGASDDGRPFFVMELVKGVPITRYCDERKLTLRQRLDLFIPVCQAVQHAHQKGIIHRDLKPSNVLVARYDDHPVPKVIDFGVAKAAGQPLTDLTLVTGFGAVVGTPEYMSPEQAQFNQLDVDTRSDIYALGVMLYELLTGSTPVNRKELQEAGLLEVFRMIREQEPPRPSTRLSTAQALPQIAADRGSEPKTLAGLLRNDLDWIVMKSLEKDRNRRYETANGLAADVQRYLSGEAVQAHPPSAAYRFQKLYRKHRLGINTASIILGLLVGAVGVSTFLAVRASRAERVARIYASEAAHNLRRADAMQEKLVEALDEAEQRRAEAESRNDPRIGLLRMARSLRDSTSDSRRILGNSSGPARVARRQFATMYVLAAGQTYANLLPEFTNGGSAIRSTAMNPRGDRWVTVSDDNTARLRDAFTGREIATLRRDKEQVVDAQLSPDGATVFTYSTDGVMRMWEGRMGAYRAQTGRLPGRIKFADPGTTVNPLQGWTYTIWKINRCSNDRVLAQPIEAAVHRNRDFRNGEIDSTVIAGQAELWDAKTGRLVARLDMPGLKVPTLEFFGEGRWIVAGEETGLHRVFSAEDGHPLGQFDTGGERFDADRIAISPSGKVAGTFIGKGIRLWDTTDWRPKLVAASKFLASFERDGGVLRLKFLDDETITLNGTHFFRAADAKLLFTTKPDIMMEYRDGLAVDETGQLFDMKTGAKIPPPDGRAYHPDLARFAPDGRFFVVCWQDLGPVLYLIDVATDKAISQKSIPLWINCFDPKQGWVGDESDGYHGTTLHRLPTPDHLEIPPKLLELWAQVAVRGHLDANGAFAKWDEPTWERNRQELARMPAPYADFPFPGHLAHDRLHWLRQEFLNADVDNQSELGAKLLQRAEALGETAEAERWRRTLAPK